MIAIADIVLDRPAENKAVLQHNPHLRAQGMQCHPGDINIIDQDPPGIDIVKDGYATKVKERGSLLSQGQRQLISFARTLLSDPAILVLDEVLPQCQSQDSEIYHPIAKKKAVAKFGYCLNIPYSNSPSVLCFPTKFARESHEKVRDKVAKWLANTNFVPDNTRALMGHMIYVDEEIKEGLGYHQI